MDFQRQIYDSSSNNSSEEEDVTIVPLETLEVKPKMEIPETPKISSSSDSSEEEDIVMVSPIKTLEVKIPETPKIGSSSDSSEEEYIVMVSPMKTLEVEPVTENKEESKMSAKRWRRLRYKQKKKLQRKLLSSLSPSPSSPGREEASEATHRVKLELASLPSILSREEFSITVNGICLDAMISFSVKNQYYNLCAVHGGVPIHSNFHPGVPPEIAASAVTDIVSLAENIRSTTPFISLTQLDKMLDDIGRLELCGLDLGFMKERVEKLKAIVNGGDGESLFMQYKEGRKRLRTTTKMLCDVNEQMERLEEQRVELAMAEQNQAALVDEMDANMRAFVDMATTPL